MAIEDLSGIGGGGGGGIVIADLIAVEKVEYATISLADVSNEYTDIIGTPGAGGKVKAYTMEGVALQYGVDYLVDVGLKRLTWNGLGLAGKIAAGDVIQIVYIATTA